MGSRIKKVHLKDFKFEIENIHGFTNLLQRCELAGSYESIKGDRI